MVFALFRKAPNQPTIDRLHGEIMAAARQPALFANFGVSDTTEGRFEVLALLATPPVCRLAALAAPGPAIAQAITDSIFTGFDDAARQIGVSDVGVPKKMYKLAGAWLGRRDAYAAAYAAGGKNLADAIARNIFASARSGEAAQVAGLARYVQAVWAAHDAAGLADFQMRPAPYPPAADFI